MCKDLLLAAFCRWFAGGIEVTSAFPVAIFPSPGAFRQTGETFLGRDTDVSHREQKMFDAAGEGTRNGSHIPVSLGCDVFIEFQVFESEVSVGAAAFSRQQNRWLAARFHKETNTTDRLQSQGSRIVGNPQVPHVEIGRIPVQS